MDGLSGKGNVIQPSDTLVRMKEKTFDFFMSFSNKMKTFDLVFSQNEKKKKTQLFYLHFTFLGGGEHSAENWCVSAMGKIAFLLSLLFYWNK